MDPFKCWATKNRRFTVGRWAISNCIPGGPKPSPSGEMLVGFPVPSLACLAPSGSSFLPQTPSHSPYFPIAFFFKRKYFTYLFLEKREGIKKETERNTDVWEDPSRGHGLHVPWLRIEPSIFQFVGWHSTLWATPARAPYFSLLLSMNISNSL